mgnify:CR=1 FL=1
MLHNKEFSPKTPCSQWEANFEIFHSLCCQKNGKISGGRDKTFSPYFVYKLSCDNVVRATAGTVMAVAAAVCVVCCHGYIYRHG